MRLWDFLKNEMLCNPNQIVGEDSANMTYEELVVFAEIFSNKLSGVKCCAILCCSEMATSMSLLSCFAAGITAVPLSVRYGKVHCNRIIDMISPDAIITDAYGELEVLHITNSEYKVPDEHPALIMCTSGTTGKPKGVMLSEQNIITNVIDICDYLKINSNDYILIARPLYHCAVLTGEFLTSLIKGTKIRFYSEQFNPNVIFDIIDNNKITVFCGTPTLLSMMSRYKRKDRSCSLKTICISGECMSKVVGEKISTAFPFTNIYHVYGLTEACPRVSYLPAELFSTHPDSVGFPLKSVLTKIIKPDGEKAKKEEEGILWVKGNNVMIGYYNDPEYTSKVLKKGWLCTGDIAVIDSEGLLKIKGRNDDLIIRAGMNIYPQEIESVLKTDPRVKDALVYRIDNPYVGVQIALKISGEFESKDQVKMLCTEILPSFQIPTVIELMDELPKNGSGKIIRR